MQRLSVEDSGFESDPEQPDRLTVDDSRLEIFHVTAQKSSCLSSATFGEIAVISFTGFAIRAYVERAELSLGCPALISSSLRVGLWRTLSPDAATSFSKVVNSVGQPIISIGFSAFFHRFKSSGPSLPLSL
jgi:hypothetical protein